MTHQPDDHARPCPGDVPAPPEPWTISRMEPDGRDSMDDGNENRRRIVGPAHDQIDVDDQPGSIYDAMGQLYGSAAALVRGDRVGVELLIEDLCRSLPSLEELLVTVAVATLERLEDAVRHVSPGDSGQPIAQQLITRAGSYRIARTATIHAAAWRLDAVRCGDRSTAADDVLNSRRIGDDYELVHGAVALFAAALEFGAAARGVDAEETARRLCYAVVLERQ